MAPANDFNEFFKVTDFTKYLLMLAVADGADKHLKSVDFSTMSSTIPSNLAFREGYAAIICQAEGIDMQSRKPGGGGL